ncbi:MAG TPA: hypothetical protein VK307_03650 [Thermoleophilaceae bacterium]|nr:hypothetical protein [Thermoleophilaceae bacterium]
MSHAHSASRDGRDSNIFGALAVAVAERVSGGAEDVAGHGGAAPAALASLYTYLDGASIDVLRRPLGLSHSAAVRLTERLAADGLVSRERGSDGRSVSVRLTRSGAAAARRLLDERRARLDAAIAPLGAAERAELTRLGEKLLAGMTGGRADAGRICRLCDSEACGHYEGLCPVTRAADLRSAPTD